ncbi:MAG: NAD(P)-dependent oxidoreductase [Bacteroidota bacterium]
MNKKILFLDKAHPVLENQLEALGFTCELDLTSSLNEVKNKLPEFIGVVMRSRLTLDEDFIDKGINLTFIAREGVGVEHIPVEYAANKGIPVLRSPEGSRDTVAEHAIGMLLMLLNKLNLANSQVKNGAWKREENRGLELMGKTVGIIGYGNMGSSFAKRLNGFGVNVLAYDKYKSNYGDQFAQEVSLKKLQEEADIVSLHIPFMESNFHFFNDDLIQGFNKNIFIINTARGLVLNTADLINHLKNGKIKGAALDVIEYEDQSFDKFNLQQLPEDFKYLQQAANVVLTPHIAGWSFESKRKHGEVLVAKIGSVLRSEESGVRGQESGVIRLTPGP